MMPTYNFSTITAAQALAIGAGDTLLLDTGPVNQTAVLYSADAPSQITVQAGARTVVFGSGLADAIKSAAGGAILIIGKAGNDGPFFGGAGDDALYGGAGDDALSGAAGADLLQGNQGRDTLSGQIGDDVIYGGQDNDLISTGNGGVLASPSRNFGQGNRGDDTVTGGGDDKDTLLGGQGNDLLGATNHGAVSPFGIYLSPSGGEVGGGDFLNGNLGDDVIFGGRGGDTLLGEGGNDGLFYFGSAGGVGGLLDGGDGEDTVVARAGAATLNGGTGNDVVGYQSGTYVISLGDGNDSCAALLETTTDRVTIDGGAGNDIIDGSDGSDSINGGAGSDTIDGYAGADTVAGGGGSDQFQFFLPEAFTNLATLDVILDWGADDRFFFTGDDIEDAIGAGTPSTYVESTAGDYASALAFANGRIALGIVNYVAVQVGSDVFVFADTAFDAGVADSAVRLMGRTLADIGFANFDGVTNSIF
jgi:Ca2+-binding RTX toxin-like protein